MHMPTKKNFDKESIKKIHTILRELRERTESQDKKALSQRELANEIGVAHSRISKLEAIDDVTEPSISDLLAYRSYFNVSIDYLLGLENEPSTDIDAKAVSKVYGISVKALYNIKRTLEEYDGSYPEFPEGHLQETLNEILESDYFELFLRNCSKYFMFYPSHSTYAYTWCAGRRLTENQEVFTFDICTQADDFIEDADKITMNSESFADILLSILKDDIKRIKESSYMYYKENLKELSIIEKEYKTYLERLESLDDTNRAGLYDSGVETTKKMYIDNIEKLKLKIRAYKM